MNQDLEKFRELLLTDTEFQGKLKAAASAYKGVQSEEAVFNAVLVPLAAEYNITATFDEFNTYIHNLSDAEMSKDELQQVAGGGKGGGVVGCIGIGIGAGGGGGDGLGAGCAVIGAGWGGVACAGEGKTKSPMDEIDC